MASPYNKPFKTVEEQIELLQSRGLEISDVNKAAETLKRIGYYRLSEYWHPMRVAETLPNGKISILPSFNGGAKFSDVVDLYIFDKRLMLLLLDAIERLEISLRVWCAHNLGEIDPYFHRNWKFLNKTFVSNTHSEWLSKIDGYARRSKNDLVYNFLQEFDHPVPIWVSVECWDFGALSYFISGMKEDDIARMAEDYSIPRRELLVSWVRTISHARNICAHHSRIWNKVLVDRPKPPRSGEIDLLDHMASDSMCHNRLYAASAIIQYFMKSVHPQSTWHERLKTHFETFPKNPYFNLNSSGFPKGWQALDLWK